MDGSGAMALSMIVSIPDLAPLIWSPWKQPAAISNSNLRHTSGLIYFSPQGAPFLYSVMLSTQEAHLISSQLSSVTTWYGWEFHLTLLPTKMEIV